MSKLRRPPGVWLGPARIGAHGHPQKNVAGAVERRRAVKWQRWLDGRLVAEGMVEYREDHPERLSYRAQCAAWALRQHKLEHSLDLRSVFGVLPFSTLRSMLANPVLAFLRPQSLLPVFASEAADRFRRLYLGGDPDLFDHDPLDYGDDDYDGEWDEPASWRRGIDYYEGDCDRWTYCDAPLPEDVKQAWLRGYIAPPGGEPFPTVEEFACWEDIPDAPWVVEAEEAARWAEYDAMFVSDLTEAEWGCIERQMMPHQVWAYDLHAWHNRKRAA